MGRAEKPELAPLLAARLKPLGDGVLHEGAVCRVVRAIERLFRERREEDPEYKVPGRYPGFHR